MAHAANPYRLMDVVILALCLRTLLILGHHCVQALF